MVEAEPAVATPMELLAPDPVVLLAVKGLRLRGQVAEVVGMRTYANLPVEFLPILRGREGREGVAVRGTLLPIKQASAAIPTPLIREDMPAARERIVVAPTTGVAVGAAVVANAVAKAVGFELLGTLIPAATVEALVKTTRQG